MSDFTKLLNQVQRIGASHTVDMAMAMQHPEDRIRNMVMRQLAQQSADFILRDMIIDKTYVQSEKRHDDMNIHYRFDAYVISDAQFQNLCAEAYRLERLSQPSMQVTPWQP